MNDDIFSLAIRHYNAGAFDEAAPLFSRFAKINPRHFAAWFYRGVTAAQQGDDRAAIKHLNKAISLKPNSPDAHNNLGLSLKTLGRFNEAAKRYRKALALDPNHVETLNNLGQLLIQQGKSAEAEPILSKAVALASEVAEIRNNLGLAYMEQSKAQAAIDMFRVAIEINANYAKAWNGLGMAEKAQGNAEAAVDAFRQALAAQPTYHTAASNLLFCLNYPSTISAENIGKEARSWAAVQESSFVPAKLLHGNQRAPEKRLRIGYVSPDFRQHSVAYFLEPILRAHDRTAFEIYCYADVSKPDAVTATMRKFSDHWCSTVGMRPGELASRIVTDEIDILVDLAGHTGGNRLLAFASHPAPVQVSWLGYCNTTGLSTIDYRLTDPIADPEDESNAYYSEQLLRLPSGFLCYAPPGDAPEVAAPPAIENGYITFGSFNNLAKMTPDVVALWSRILNVVSNSRLLLKNKWLTEKATADQIAARFAPHGIERSRLELIGRIKDTSGHLGAYGRMDIALDPFPYCGTTTTCEALWMGRPVLTLRGDRHAARVGASILTYAGLEHLIAVSEQAYVERAIALARDPRALQVMAPDLRKRMRDHLCDAETITRDIETAYRSIWQTWCEAPTS